MATLYVVFFLLKGTRHASSLPQYCVKASDFHVSLLEIQLQNVVFPVSRGQFQLHAFIATGHHLHLLVETVQVLGVLLSCQQFVMLLQSTHSAIRIMGTFSTRGLWTPLETPLTPLTIQTRNLNNKYFI